MQDGKTSWQQLTLWQSDVCQQFPCHNAVHPKYGGYSPHTKATTGGCRPQFTLAWGLLPPYQRAYSALSAIMLARTLP